MMKRLKNRRGFTLIEIIAVLVILGILAAVAIPKFLDLQNESKRRGAAGFVAAGQSALSMAYARLLLDSTAPTNVGVICNTVNISAPAGVTATLTCTGGPLSASAAANVNLTGNYDGQVYNGTWQSP